MTDRPIWDESDYQRVQTPVAERGGRGNLTIIREDVLVAIPRGDEESRVTFTIAKTPEGKDTAWHSIREYYQDRVSGAWRPTKKGITIRGRELHAVAAAFAKATSGGPPPPSAPRQPLPHEEYDRRAGRPVR